jgi:hypothetical protein
MFTIRNVFEDLFDLDDLEAGVVGPFEIVVRPGLSQYTLRNGLTVPSLQAYAPGIGPGSRTVRLRALCGAVREAVPVTILVDAPLHFA